MAQIDPWDPHLEAVTERLDRMTSGKLRGRVALVHPASWTLDCRGAGRSLTFQFAHAAGMAFELDDYARAVMYGGGWQPLGNEGRPIGFGKTLSLRDGYHWDEESIREQVLEAIGVMRYLLAVPDPGSVEFQDHSRQGPISVAKSSVHRRRKR